MLLTILGSKFSYAKGDIIRGVVDCVVNFFGLNFQVVDLFARQFKNQHCCILSQSQVLEAFQESAWMVEVCIQCGRKWVVADREHGVLSCQWMVEWKHLGHELHLTMYWWSEDQKFHLLRNGASQHQVRLLHILCNLNKYYSDKFLKTFYLLKIEFHNKLLVCIPSVLKKLHIHLITFDYIDIYENIYKLI